MTDGNSVDVFGRPTVQIDRQAPDFIARSTQGDVRLSDYRGRWLVFFSHPADFTPVCTTEFVAFQKMKPHFDARGCDLLGLSVDSLYAHLAWIGDIESRFGERIDFPIIEDISMSVSRAYGMLNDDSVSTATVRSLFIIDPGGYVRALIHYPMSVGRSVDEVLRTLAALQEAQASNVATPEGWVPGEPTLLPPPIHQAETDERAALGGASWYVTEAEAVRHGKD